MKFGQEPGCAGSIRVFMSGAVHVLLFEYSTLINVLSPTPEEGVLSKLQKLDDKDVGAFKLKDIAVWHGQIDANQTPQALLIPPGFFVAMCCINGPASGFRKPFLSYGSRAISSMALCANGGDGSAKVFLDLMKAAQASSAVAPDPKKRAAKDPEKQPKKKANK